MHDVQALISSHEGLSGTVAEVQGAVICPLPSGFSLLPVTRELLVGLHQARFVVPSATPPLSELSTEVHALALQLSLQSPVAFVSTEYFGGSGGQDAIAWVNGQVVFSPATAGYNREWPNSPISQALRRIGVVALEGKDEFDTVGLGAHRSTERWAAAHSGA